MMPGSWYSLDTILTPRPRMIANQSPTHRLPIAAHIQPFLMDSSRPLVPNWSGFDRRLIVDWSATKKWRFFIARWLLCLQLFFGRKAVADRWKCINPIMVIPHPRCQIQFLDYHLYLFWSRSTPRFLDWFVVVHRFQLCRDWFMVHGPMDKQNSLYETAFDKTQI